MSYNVLLSDAVSDYLNSQDRGRQAILKHLRNENDPFKGDVIRLKPPPEALSQENREHSGAFQHKGEDVYLELMVIAATCMSGKRLERNIG